MGRLAKVLSFTRITRNGAKTSDVKVDPGGGPNVTGDHLAPPGDDSYPLPGDYGILSRLLATGRDAIVGYLDPKNQQKAGPGEKRIYSRDSSGNEIAQVWLKANGDIVAENDTATVTIAGSGSIKGDNGSGSFELLASGVIDLNGVTISPTGVVTVSSSLTVAGKELAGHTHPAGTPPGDTGANN